MRESDGRCHSASLQLRTGLRQTFSGPTSCEDADALPRVNLAYLLSVRPRRQQLETAFWDLAGKHLWGMLCLCPAGMHSKTGLAEPCFHPASLAQSQLCSMP